MFKGIRNLPTIAWVIYMIFACVIDYLWGKALYEYFINNVKIGLDNFDLYVFIFITTIINLLAVIAIFIVPYKVNLVSNKIHYISKIINKLIIKRNRDSNANTEDGTNIYIKDPHNKKGYLGCILGTFLALFFLYSVIIYWTEYSLFSIVWNIFVIAFLLYQIYKRLL
jgi:hypothetical protein